MKITAEQKQTILDKVKADVEERGSRNLSYIIFTVCGSWLKGSDDRHYLEELSGKLIEDGYYIRKLIKIDSSLGYTYQIFKNPQYNYLEEQKRTNVSTIKLNQFLKRSNWITIAIAAFTGFFIALQTFNCNSNSQSKINQDIINRLERMDKTDSISGRKDSIIHLLQDSIKK